MKADLILKFYQKLYRHFGPQHWWPGETPFEVMVGAILTQNTAWKNVERAIENLKKENALSPEEINKMNIEKLAQLIKPSGFYNLKAKRLKSFIERFMEDFHGDIQEMKKLEKHTLREWLLSIPGIGRETADSIILYAIEKPIFVVDAYTRRILSRHGFIKGDEDYDEIQEIFHRNLPHDTGLFNEYHALIVRLGKEYCKKQNPLCETCPLKDYL
ncbi:MAG TPA: endonuclease III domain-containing protein, partial [candidate division WOR-3 bacterium]|nr:endonuclease III domain-containing protein [candidate division WOR-3 bacterium]